MKVFFVGSPRALNLYQEYFKKIYSTIEELGHENIYDLMVSSDPNTFYDRTEEEIILHYRRTVKCLQESDVTIIESSIHSLSMGYLVRMSEELEKPVIILYQEGKQPFFFRGHHDERFILVEYRRDNIKEVLAAAFQYAKESLDIRFNMFLSTKMHMYLKNEAKKMGIPCSIFMRQLLQEHMTKNNTRNEID